MVEVNNTKGTCRYTVATAITDVLLDHDRIELRAKQGPGWACLQAGRWGAVFAHVAHHQPVALKRLLRGGALALGIAEALNESHVTPGGGRKAPGVVIALAGQADIVDGQGIPLL